MQNSRRTFLLLSLFIGLFVLPSITSTASRVRENVYVTMSLEWLLARTNNQEMILSMLHSSISAEGAAYLRGRIAVYTELIEMADINNAIIVKPNAEQP